MNPGGIERIQHQGLGVGYVKERSERVSLRGQVPGGFVPKALRLRCEAGQKGRIEDDDEDEQRLPALQVLRFKGDRPGRIFERLQ